jgi:NitT/TauT family transport system ATP-binding protein
MVAGPASTGQDATVDAAGAGPGSLRCSGLGITLVGATGPVEILRDLTFTIAAGTFVSLLGASGSGKTTLLRTLGGLQPSTVGQVLCHGKPVNGPPQGVVTVFQDYGNSLLPWRSVRRNVALGIEATVSKDECEARVLDALDMVELRASADEYPWRLSGGMQQRVQIARALAMRPSVLLMDEPFGALDAMTKASLQDQLQRVHELTGTTVVFVTHDVEEAVYLSDRVLVLNGRPAGIGLDLDIALPRPRVQVTTKESPEYLQLRHQVYRALGHGTGH